MFRYWIPVVGRTFAARRPPIVPLGLHGSWASDFGSRAYQQTSIPTRSLSNFCSSPGRFTTSRAVIGGVHATQYLAAGRFGRGDVLGLLGAQRNTLALSFCHARGRIVRWWCYWSRAAVLLANVWSAQVAACPCRVHSLRPARRFGASCCIISPMLVSEVWDSLGSGCAVACGGRDCICFLVPCCGRFL